MAGAQAVAPDTTLTRDQPAVAITGRQVSTRTASGTMGVPDAAASIFVSLDRTLFLLGRITLAAEISLDDGNTFAHLCSAVIDGGDTSANGRGGTTSSVRLNLPPGTGRQVRLSVDPTGSPRVGHISVTVS